MDKALLYIDLQLSNRVGSVAHLLSRCRGLIFNQLKNALWDKAIEDTQYSEGQFELQLSRFRAAKFIKSGQTDNEGQFMCFSQAFRQMHNMPSRRFRNSERVYKVILAGEQAIDAGGPYRESFGMYCQELQSSAMPLLLPTPNGRHAIGQHRDQWLLNPGR